jgi:hypothetical protein
VGAETMPLLDRSVRQAPDEHVAFLPEPGDRAVAQS